MIESASQKYVHAPDGHYPYRLRAIDGGDPERSAKRMYPNVSPLPATWEQCTPEQRAALHAEPVISTTPPVLAPGERLAEGDPEFVDGEWRQTWVVTPALPPQPAPVPESVLPHHLRRALRIAGLRATVEAAIAALPADHPMRDDWEYAPSIRRDAAGVEAIRQALALTTEQVDALFIAAGAQQT